MLQISHAIANPEGSFVEADEAYCRLVRLSPAQLRRRDIMSLTHPADHACNSASLRGLIDCGMPFWIRKRYVRDDGSLVWVLNHVSRVFGHAGRVRIVAACFPIPPGFGGEHDGAPGAGCLATQTNLLRTLL